MAGVSPCPAAQGPGDRQRARLRSGLPRHAARGACGDRPAGGHQDGSAVVQGRNGRRLATDATAAARAGALYAACAGGRRARRGCQGDWRRAFWRHRPGGCAQHRQPAGAGAGPRAVAGARRCARERRHRRQRGRATAGRTLRPGLRVPRVPACRLCTGDGRLQHRGSGRQRQQPD
ncbi:hypothetical protein COLO4_01837, partial [Corchorus olitorius]